MTEPGLVGALPTRDRALAPDLARGLMLLLIAVVHAFGYSFGGAPGTVYPGELDTAESVTVGAVTLLASSRALPMFAALFGYGLVLVAERARRGASGWAEVDGPLRRRGLWLLLFGFAHAALLFSGDILGAYGVLALLLAGVLCWEPSRVLGLAAVVALAGSLLYLGMVVPEDTRTGGGSGPTPDTTLLADAGARLEDWPLRTIVALFTVAGPMLAGVWAARRGLLHHPQRHTRLLRWVAGVGITGSVLGAVPVLLVNLRVLTGLDQAGRFVVYWVDLVTGYGGGLGYAAAVALVAVHIGRRAGGPGRIARALAACGQWSLTVYLLQSVAWFVLFYGYTLNLPARLTVTQAVLVAAAVWALLVVLAAVGARGGRRGPLETALRRLTYGRR